VKRKDLLWLQVEGYPHAYNLRLILNTGRCAEGNWAAEAVPGLVQAAQMLKISEFTLAVPNIVLIYILVCKAALVAPLW